LDEFSAPAAIQACMGSSVGVDALSLLRRPVTVIPEALVWGNSRPCSSGQVAVVSREDVQQQGTRCLHVAVVVLRWLMLECAALCRAAKAVGDRRATVAEKGFNRPLFRVVVAKGGAVAS
jgi:hypothetical protein